MRKEHLDRFKDSTVIDISNHYYLVYKPLIRDIKYAINNYSAGKVLDIGCGNKPYKSLFENKCDEYVGCDIVQSSEKCVDIICDATNIPLDDNSIDTIFCTQVIEHVDDHNRLLKEIFRLLKPDGHIILSGPMYWHLHEEPYDFFRFTKYGFKFIFENQGLRPVEILANGGKWATFGQMVIHTFPNFLIKRKLFRKYSNMFFSYLDDKYYYDYNTMNYLVIAKK
ncbi:class I SAM-dependent methyltransferase [Salinimicrobium sediminilitoris]|uniref:class I SAM-dependent methyltransferase n=1 Tax=Salinimicrobium sediminilitoris TaxID=2876715 RepID=UPI001E30ADB9|nr:class I SAM-dependent methyltransferase [Salinimicrobium sediminilitoris]MCC8358514.1 class I SAM-dependent methyltransferase [Salinimicrobium sediminilitoris]